MNINYSGTGDYAPQGVKETTLFIGNGENVVSLDLEASQTDVAQHYMVRQDCMGSLHLHHEGEEIPAGQQYLAAYIDIPPAFYEIVDTGETKENSTSGEQEPIKVRRKIPVDIGNVTLTLTALSYALNKMTKENTEA